MRRLIGNMIAGLSVAGAMLIVAPERTFTWPWFIALCVACFGTAVGDAVIRGPHKR